MPANVTVKVAVPVAPDAAVTTPYAPIIVPPGKSEVGTTIPTVICVPASTVPLAENVAAVVPEPVGLVAPVIVTGAAGYAVKVVETLVYVTGAENVTTKFGVPVADVTDVTVAVVVAGDAPTKLDMGTIWPT